MIEEDFPEEEESNEEENENNYMINNKIFKKDSQNIHLPKKEEKNLKDENAFKRNIILKKPLRKHEFEFPHLRRGKKNSKQSSPNKIIPQKYLTKYNELIIGNDTNYKYYRKLEFNGKTFNLVSKNEDLEKDRDLYYYCTNHRTKKTCDRT